MHGECQLRQNALLIAAVEIGLERLASIHIFVEEGVEVGSAFQRAALIAANFRCIVAVEAVGLPVSRS
jgi:hypothetical protein